MAFGISAPVLSLAMPLRVPEVLCAKAVHVRADRVQMAAIRPARGLFMDLKKNSYGLGRRERGGMRLLRTLA